MHAARGRVYLEEEEIAPDKARQRAEGEAAPSALLVKVANHPHELEAE
jgi:hypothetical protein